MGKKKWLFQVILAKGVGERGFPSREKIKISCDLLTIEFFVGKGMSIVFQQTPISLCSPLLYHKIVPLSRMLKFT